MRIAAVMAWGVLLLLFTCTASLQDLMHHGIIRLQWEPDPNLRDLWIVKDARIWDAEWLRIKCGHMLGFGIFGLLCRSMLRKDRTSVLAASFFACATEVLQLYCSRDGRLVDMGIDIAGILLCSLLLSASRRAMGSSVKPSHG